MNLAQANALLSVPDPNAPRVALHERFVTRTTLAALWGIERSAAVMAALVATGNPIAAEAAAMLSGPGIDAGHPQTRALVPQFVALGLITQDEADSVLALGASTQQSVAQEVLGRDATAEDVTLAGRIVARHDEVQAIRSRLQSLVTDPRLDAAEIDPDVAVPTLAELVAE